jgi:hypothetical protein
MAEKDRRESIKYSTGEAKPSLNEEKNCLAEHEKNLSIT